jgi:hypothetical protein
MAKPFRTAIDLGKNELQNPRAQNLGSDPGSPVEGQFFWRTDTKKWRVYNGTAWEDLGGGGSGIPATIVDAKGDLIVATAADTVARKAVGANGTLLVANSAQGDGLEWRTLVDGDIPAAIARDSEVASAVSAHETDATDAHDATAVSFAPADSIAATDVQAAIVEALTDARTYADSVAAGLQWKASVRVAATGNVAIATALENGDTLDGVVLATGDRVLLPFQSTGSQNGIYVVPAAGAASRAADANTSAEVTSGMAVFVEEGATYADTGWVLTTNDPITLDTTALTFTQFTSLGQVTAGAGMTKTGSTLDVIGGEGITVEADAIKINRAVTARGFAATFGDAAATSFNIDHNLNTKDIVVSVKVVSTGEEVMCDVTATTVNRVVLAFAAAPANNELRVTVLGIGG